MANYHEMYKMQQMSDPQKRLNNPLDVYFIYKDEDDEKNVYRQIDEGIRKVLEQKAKEAKEAKKKSENEKVAKERAAKLDAIKNASPVLKTASSFFPKVNIPLKPEPIVPELEPEEQVTDFEIKPIVIIKQNNKTNLEGFIIKPTNDKFTDFSLVKEEEEIPDGFTFDKNSLQVNHYNVVAGKYNIKIKAAKYDGKEVKTEKTADLKITVIEVKYADIKGTVGKELEKTINPTITPNDIDLNNKITFIAETEPPLPAGLNIDDKGVISGTPIEPTTNAEGNLSAKDYIVNYSYGDLKGTATINIKIEPEEITLNYTTQKAVYEIGQTDKIENKPLISPLANGKEHVYTYSIEPTSLPTGLTLNAETGVITGTPTEKTDGKKEYTITATNTKYKNTNKKPCIISITVNEKPIPEAIPELKYEGKKDNYKQGDNCELILVESSREKFTNFKVEGLPEGLPEGLKLDPNSGKISGTVTQKLTTEEEKKIGKKTFEVKVTADLIKEPNSKQTTTMQITVLKRDNIVFSYDDIKGQQSQPILPISPTIKEKIKIKDSTTSQEIDEVLKFKFKDEANKPEEFTIEELTGEIKAANPLKNILKPTDYTITVQDMFENTFETTVKISVKPKEPIKFKYADIGGTVGQQITDTSPTLVNENEGNIADYYKIFTVMSEDDLGGLNLDAKTGVISGFPTKEVSNGTVTITGMDWWGDKFDTIVKINIEEEFTVPKFVPDAVVVHAPAPPLSADEIRNIQITYDNIQGIFGEPNPNKITPTFSKKEDTNKIKKYTIEKCIITNKNDTAEESNNDVKDSIKSAISIVEKTGEITVDFKQFNNGYKNLKNITFKLDINCYYNDNDFIPSTITIKVLSEKDFLKKIRLIFQQIKLCYDLIFNAIEKDYNNNENNNRCIITAYTDLKNYKKTYIDTIFEGKQNDEKIKSIYNLTTEIQNMKFLEEKKRKETKLNLILSFLKFYFNYSNENIENLDNEITISNLLYDNKTKHLKEIEARIINYFINKDKKDKDTCDKVTVNDNKQFVEKTGTKFTINEKLNTDINEENFIKNNSGDVKISGLKTTANTVRGLIEEKKIDDESKKILKSVADYIDILNKKKISDLLEKIYEKLTEFINLAFDIMHFGFKDYTPFDDNDTESGGGKRLNKITTRRQKKKKIKKNTRKRREHSTFKSTFRSTFGKSATKPTFRKSATKPTFGKSATKPTFGKSATKPTFGKSATKPTFGKSATKHDKNIRKNTRKKHL